MELTKREIKSIKKYDSEFNLDKIEPSMDARGKEITDIIVFSLGRKERHDSGYPFLRMIGRYYEQSLSPTMQYYDLGWHDHFICNIPVNIDSFGKNLFRIMPWRNKESWKVSPDFISVSTFEIGSPYPDIRPTYTLS